MNVSESPVTDRAQPSASHAPRMRLQDIEPQLREMLADEDWRPACSGIARLQELLRSIDHEPGAGAASVPPDVALLVAAHQDFTRFRRALAARLNAPDDAPLRISPDEWLYLRLRHPDKAANLAPYARYRLENERFQVD